MPPSSGFSTLYISRIVIFEKLGSDPVVIRDIKLGPGLNIIHAPSVLLPKLPDKFTGHSAGKTSFCRLIRYLLGDDNYGKKIDMQHIQARFPSGYVGAEVVISGVKWAVLRPLGNKALRSFVMERATVEDLISKRGQSVTQDMYITSLGLDRLVDKFKSINAGGDFSWQHMLAWITPDQGVNFKNMAHWRAGEKISCDLDLPSAVELNRDLFMKTALGIFSIEDLVLKERLKDLKKQQVDLGKKCNKLRKIPEEKPPQTVMSKRLRQQLKSLHPEIEDLDQRPLKSAHIYTESLESLTRRSIARLGEEIEKMEHQRRQVQEAIEKIRVEISLIEIMNSDIENVNSSKLSQKKLREQRDVHVRHLQKRADKLCPLGNVKSSDCLHARQRSQQLKRDSQLAETELQEIASDGLFSGETLAEKLGQLDSLLHDQESFLNDIKGKEQLLSELTLSLETALAEEYAERDARKTQLSVVSNKLQDVCNEIEQTEKEIEQLKAQSESESEENAISLLFSSVVQEMLGEGYSGKFVSGSLGMKFIITDDGFVKSGESFETLAGMLGNIVFLMYSAIHDGCFHPGFLLHDSPRQADLDPTLYEKYLSCVASVCCDPETGIPLFQYILTTTTDPPEHLQTNDFVKLKLSGATAEEMLYRCILAMSPAQIKMWS